MQYGGNQQQRVLNMMMQARQQQQQAATARQQQSVYSSYPSLPRPNHPGSGGGGGGVMQPGAGPQQHQHQQHQQMKQLPYVSSLNENDVLLGRGTPCAENEGNVRFRRLVRRRKTEYIAAEKRVRKDAIAREILEVIGSRGGKFLRKVESKLELIQLGVPAGISYKDVWAIVDEDTQVQKVKQALRNKDDTGELPPPSEGEKLAAARGSWHCGPGVRTNQLPRGVIDERDIHRADCNIQFGAGSMMERVGGNNHNLTSDDEGKAGSKFKGMNSPAGLKKPSATASKLASDTVGAGFLPSSAAGRRLSGGIGDIPHAARMSSSMEMSSPRHNILAMDAQRFPGGLPPPPAMADMIHRDSWEKSKAAPSEGELRSLRELQRLRMMREQMGINPAALGPTGTGGLDAGAGLYGSNNYSRGLVDVEIRQMQAQQMQAQQLQAQRMAAARGHAAAFRGNSIPSITSGTVAGGAPLHSSAAAMAARQLQLESLMPSRRFSGGALGGLPQETMQTLEATSVARGPAGADSAGERAIGIAHAMKRAEAFSAAESLELSQLETLILSTLCSHGLPVWNSESQSKSFVDMPAFAAKRFDWTWCDVASLLRQKVARYKASPSSPEEAHIAALTLEAANEYLADPRELATKTIMLIERLRRHSSAGTTQRKQWSGLGMRVPLWLDRELSRWAMSLGIADPTGRPVPFAATDFVAEHPGYKSDPSILATAAFDPQLADDVVDQVALLTRLRSVFASSKDSHLHAKIVASVKKADATGDGWQDQPKGWESSEGNSVSREMLICDRLLREGFPGVSSSINDLASELISVTTDPHTYPSFASMGLTKSAIQQRANQITRELHIVDESQDMQDLLGGRMQRFARTILHSTGESRRSSETGMSGGQSPAAASRVLHLLAGAGSIDSTLASSLRKRSAGSIGSESSDRNVKPKGGLN